MYGTIVHFLISKSPVSHTRFPWLSSVLHITSSLVAHALLQPSSPIHSLYECLLTNPILQLPPKHSSPSAQLLPQRSSTLLPLIRLTTRSLRLPVSLPRYERDVPGKQAQRHARQQPAKEVGGQDWLRLKSSECVGGEDRLEEFEVHYC